MARRPQGVRRRADGRWEARRSIGPREAAVRLSGYGATMAEALADLDRKIGEHQRRLDLDVAADWSLADYLDWWTGEELASRISDRTLSVTTFRQYERVARLHLKPSPVAVRTRLADLSAVHVRRILEDHRAAGMTASGRERVHTVLVVALSCAVDYELVAGNAASRVRAPRTADKGRRQEVGVDGARRLLAASADHRMAGLWRLLLAVPLRPGEPLGAIVDDFDLEAGTYTVARNLVRYAGGWRLHETKGRRARTVPLPADAVEALRAHVERRDMERSWAGGGWVDPTVTWPDGTVGPADLMFRMPSGTPIWDRTLGEWLTDMCAAAGVERLTPHGLRHAACTLLEDAGVHPAVVQQLAGHRSASMTDHYIAALQGSMREAVDLLAARLRDDPGRGQ